MRNTPRARAHLEHLLATRPKAQQIGRLYTAETRRTFVIEAGRVIEEVVESVATVEVWIMPVGPCLHITLDAETRGGWNQSQVDRCPDCMPPAPAYRERE